MPQLIQVKVIHEPSSAIENLTEFVHLETETILSQSSKRTAMIIACGSFSLETVAECDGNTGNSSSSFLEPCADVIVSAEARRSILVGGGGAPQVS